MTELSPMGETLPRPNYSFEQLEAAVEIAPFVDLAEISSDFKLVGKMMVDKDSTYHIFVNADGMFIKALVFRD